MKSPFPGMDPYLEGYLWPDVHHELASAIKELIIPQISPKYLARLARYTVEDTSPEEEVGIMYPDVEVLHRKKRVEEPVPRYGSQDLPPITPANISIPATNVIEVRIPVIEIRDRQRNKLITAIEILSPVNKRNPGIHPYREKRKRLHESGVHLLEIDLIRRGTRPFSHPYLPSSHYLITLMRAGVGKTDAWTIDIKDALPVLPVPLIAPDPDAKLELGAALHLIYNRSQYHLSVNYEKAPPPPNFSKTERDWMKALIGQN